MLVFGFSSTLWPVVTVEDLSVTFYVILAYVFYYCKIVA